jgi:hypothetical protein
MSKTLARIQLLKKVLASVGAGRGVSASVVLAFRGGGGAERLAARMVLLGHPPRRSMASIVSDQSRELGMLASLVTMASGSNLAAIGRKGSEFSALMERWLKAKEERLMEQKVFQMRGLIMSAVLGAVMATVSALGPLVGAGELFAGGGTSAGPALNYASAAMVVVSSSMIGLFLSGRRFYLNLVLALAVFSLALSASSPLAPVPTVSLWGIK